MRIAPCLGRASLGHLRDQCNQQIKNHLGALLGFIASASLPPSLRHRTFCSAAAVGAMARHRARAWRGSTLSARRPPHGHLTAAPPQGLVAVLRGSRAGLGQGATARGPPMRCREGHRPPRGRGSRRRASCRSRGLESQPQARRPTATLLLARAHSSQRAWSSGRSPRHAARGWVCMRTRMPRRGRSCRPSAGAPPESRGAAAPPFPAAARRGRARGPRGGGRRARGASWSAASRGRAPRPPHSRATRQSSRAWCRPSCARLQTPALGLHVRREKSGAKGWRERAGGSRDGREKLPVVEAAAQKGCAAVT